MAPTWREAVALEVLGSVTVGGGLRSRLSDAARTGSRPSARPRSIALILLVTAFWVLLPVDSAIASACPQNPDGSYKFAINHVADKWQPSDFSVTGIRAPIVMRRGTNGGSICSPVGHAASWVGIEASGGGAISQIGWSHDAMGYCRFTEWFTASNPNGTATYDLCDTQNGDGAERLFKVAKFFNQDDQQYHYGIFDCGTVDWSACIGVDVGPTEPGIPYPEGAVDAESNFGGADCGNGAYVNIMGSTGHRVRFGETGDEIKGQRSIGGSWGIHTLNYVEQPATFGGFCPHYRSDGTIGTPDTDGMLRTYDDRN